MSDPEVTSETEKSSQHTVSETFGNGHGDLALLSSDGVIFHFSSFLLAYTSPVFKDMFEIASKAEKVNNQLQDLKSQPLSLSEDAVTLDLLLRHIDPVTTILPPKKSTIVKLLDAARKYQFPTIIQWFQVEVKRGELPVQGGDSDKKSLIQEDPMLVLSLSIDHDLKDLAKEALFAAINGEPPQEMESWGDVKYYLLVHRLREKRVEKFLELIRKISDLEEECVKDLEEECVRDSDEDEYWRARSPSREMRPIQKTICKCSQTRSSWILDITEYILYMPTWDHFMKGIRSHDYCSKEWSEQAEGVIYGEEDTIREEEKKVPDLP